MTKRISVLGWLLMGAMLLAQDAPRAPSLHKPAPQPTSAYDQPLTGYEAVVLIAEFIQNLEHGLSEAFEKPIRTAGAGEVSLSGKHPAWAQKALLELKRRGLIPPGFNGRQPIQRYQVGIMLARYAQRLDTCMRTQLGNPIGRTRFQTQPRIALAPRHPAYASLKYLAAGAWVGADSLLYREPEGALRGKELPDMLQQLARRILERYTHEKHLEEPPLR
ncbi:hypothetical protein HRbin15_01421 [bacterium HR15]|nr:hypothetical protein HRbin15_01421 [bacterium HR15]